MTGLVLFCAEHLSRSWRRRSRGIKMGVSDTDVLHADTRLKWKCAFLGRPSSPPPPPPPRLSGCNQMTDWTAAFTQSERAVQTFTQPFTMSHTFTFPLRFTSGVSNTWQALHNGISGASLISIQWVENVGFSGCLCGGAGPIWSKFTKQSDRFT